MSAPRTPSPLPQHDPPKDRLTVRFLGVHIEGVGRGVKSVITALAIVGVVLIATVILGRLL